METRAVTNHTSQGSMILEDRQELKVIKNLRFLNAPRTSRSRCLEILRLSKSKILNSAQESQRLLTCGGHCFFDLILIVIGI